MDLPDMVGNALPGIRCTKSFSPATIAGLMAQSRGMLRDYFLSSSSHCHLLAFTSEDEHGSLFHSSGQALLCFRTTGCGMCKALLPLRNHGSLNTSGDDVHIFTNLL